MSTSLNERTIMMQRDVNGSQPLQNDEPTIQLVIKAQSGDAAALDAILKRNVPQLKRWAHGRLPAAARGHLDTSDVVQDAVLQILRRIHCFEPRHVGAMQAFLRRTVANRICDEARRQSRRPQPISLREDHPFTGISPHDAAIHAETDRRYRDALPRLRSKDRALVIAIVEWRWTYREIAQHFTFRTVGAARMATKRALRRLEIEISG
jgi:RNA polymerase sigma factor (sigma-70 family)